MHRKSYQHDFMMAFLSPTPSLIATYLLGLLATSVLGNWFYTILTAPQELTAGQHVGALAGGFTFVFVAFMLWISRRPLTIPWEEGELADPCQALIAIPSNPNTVIVNIKHHGKHLKHLWLVGDFDVMNYDAICKQINDGLEGYTLNYNTHKADIANSDGQSVYDAIFTIYRNSIYDYRIPEDQIAVDITNR